MFILHIETNFCTVWYYPDVYYMEQILFLS